MAIRQSQGEPGVLVDSDSGKRYQVGDSQPRVLFDTVVITTGLQVANTEYLFFQNTANKKGQHTNMGNQKRIPAGRFFELHRVGVRIWQIADGSTQVVDDDLLRVIDNFYVEFYVNTIEVARGPVVHYPSGYGSSGNAFAGGSGLVNNGMPNQAAQTGLIEPTIITDQVDLNGKLVIFDATWNTNAVMPTILSRVYASLELTGVLFTAATI